jgi:predicted acyltransferase
MRLEALDVFRGLTLALMILVNTPGDGDHVYSQLQHVDWHGWTITDGVFPSFVWIIGVAAALVIPRRLAQGRSKAEILQQATRRSVILFLLGVLLYLYPHFEWGTFRLLGVLQRLAICYWFTAVAVLYLSARAQASVAALCLGGYWIAMALGGDLSQEGNLAHAVDRALLGVHNYSHTKTWDPEGVLSTIPAIASCLIGALAGLRLEPRFLLLSGAALAVAGQVAGLAFPINKMLWSPSFVLWMAGLDAMLLGALIHAIDGRGVRKPFAPFLWLGMNAILMYLLSEYIEITLAWQGWKQQIHHALFVPWFSSVNASLAYALTYVLLHVLIAFILYRRKVFVRI